MDNSLLTTKSDVLNMKTLITGGAGFIGSHLVDSLMAQEHSVSVYDNLASGKLKNLEKWQDNRRFSFNHGDLLNPPEVAKAVKDSDVVFHLAANPEVDAKKASPMDHFQQNITATYNLLEAVREAGCVERLAFTSSSTVYGEAEVYPTPEEYGPLIPISLYGASKLACEALISAYSSMYGFRSAIFRLANVVGPRTYHGVIHDFVDKLRKTPEMLEVLGDGSQSKSYLYVSDCIEGIMKGMVSGKQVAIYNIGTEDQVSVLDIAEIVKEETGCSDAVIRLTGGVDGGRGWRGDVKKMLLDTQRLLDTGWAPKYTSSEAVRLTARSLAG